LPLIVFTNVSTDIFNITSFQAAVLKTQVEALLHMVKQSHYITEEDNSWIEFLIKAVAHNNNKLSALNS
jgi:hypothetical protein